MNLEITICLKSTIDDGVMDVSIEKSHYNNKSRYYDGNCADWGLSL